jgi:hypothetical protein
VDQLSSRRPDRAAESVARDRVESRERRTERLLAQLTEDLTTTSPAAAMLTAEGSPLGRRLSADSNTAVTRCSSPPTGAAAPCG